MMYWVVSPAQRRALVKRLNSNAYWPWEKRFERPEVPFLFRGLPVVTFHEAKAIQRLNKAEKVQ